MTTTVDIKRAHRANVQAMKLDALANYESTVWATAESQDPVATVSSELGAILFAAEKTIDNFVADVEAIRQRIASQPQVAEYAEVGAELASLTATRKQVVAERDRVVREFDAKLASLDSAARGLTARQKSLRPAVLHFHRTCPAWLREKIDAAKKSLARVQTQLRRLNPPPTPRHASESPVMVGMLNPERRQAADAAFARQEANYYEKKHEYEQLRDELPQRESQLQRQLDELQAQALQLRPTPND